jgi:hypothetical protein
VTHYIPYFTTRIGSRQRAFCGEFAEIAQHSTEPDCVECKARLDADNSIDADALKRPDPEFPPVSIPDFDPCAGYRLRGGAR